MRTFYITTTLPYVNAAPHLGFALEAVQADILARYHREILKEDVIFNTGTDEHGVKILRKAEEEGRDVQAYVDEYAAKFEKLKQALNLSYDRFIRTTNPEHKAAAQEFWRICKENGHIYLAEYKIKYCSGCELEKTESELVDGRCPLHPNLQIEEYKEENYFFKFSAFAESLKKMYGSNPDFVVPSERFNEIKSFIEHGLNDFSISRLREKMPWGIPVPDDDKHVMYVWFDALINYISTLGWPKDKDSFEKYWGTAEEPKAHQIAGKDNLRQQSAMWQAMLSAAGLPNSKQILIHGFITSNGQKMSKSLGNVVDPMEVVSKFGTDALRYWISREANVFGDSDFTWDKFQDAYNSSLANGLGNLVSRSIKMAQICDASLKEYVIDKNTEGSYFKALDSFDFKSAMDGIWADIAKLDAYIQETEPFRLVKTDKEKAKEHMEFVLNGLHRIGVLLAPFMPQTSKKIVEALEKREVAQALFPRVS